MKVVVLPAFPRFPLQTVTVTVVVFCFPGYTAVLFKENLNASQDLLSIPLSGGEMSKRLGGTIGCKDKKNSSWQNGFPDGSNIGSTV